MYGYTAELAVTNMLIISANLEQNEHFYSSSNHKILRYTH